VWWFGWKIYGDDIIYKFMWFITDMALIVNDESNPEENVYIKKALEMQEGLREIDANGIDAPWRYNADI
jgi:hypothetical protein